MPVQRSADFYELFGADDVSASISPVPSVTKTTLATDDPFFTYSPVGHRGDEICHNAERDELTEKLCGDRSYGIEGLAQTVRPESHTPMADLFGVLVKAAKEKRKADLKSNACPCTCAPCRAANCPGCEGEEKCPGWLPEIQGKSPTGLSLRKIRADLSPILQKFETDFQHLRKNRPLHNDQCEALNDLEFYAIDFVHEIVSQATK